MQEQISRFIYWVKGRLHVVDVALPGLWVWAWLQNAGGSHYDLDKLWQIYLAIRGFILAQFGIDSKLNSPPGVAPGKEGQNAPKV